MKGLVADALTYCDMTIGPDGNPVEIEERLAEVIVRYGDGDLVAESIQEARTHIERSAQRVRAILGADSRIGE